MDFLYTPSVYFNALQREDSRRRDSVAGRGNFTQSRSQKYDIGVFPTYILKFWSIMGWAGRRCILFIAVWFVCILYAPFNFELPLLGEWKLVRNQFVEPLLTYALLCSLEVEGRMYVSFFFFKLFTYISCIGSDWLRGSLALTAVHQSNNGHREDNGSRNACSFTEVGWSGVLVGGVLMLAVEAVEYVHLGPFPFGFVFWDVF